jgi:N-acetyl-gamma-glutamyl-phosphate reductase
MPDNMKTKKIAIVGASGYSGEVLVQLLLNHPQAELVAVTSRQNTGQTLAQVFPKFASHPVSKTMRFHRTERRSAGEAGRHRSFSRCRTASPPNTPCRW